MKKQVKIVTIGGGSSYTPELIEGFIRRYEELPIGEMWLVDVERGKEKLRIVSELAQRMWDASPYQVKVHTSPGSASGGGFCDHTVPCGASGGSD